MAGADGLKNHGIRAGSIALYLIPIAFLAFVIIYPFLGLVYRYVNIAIFYGLFEKSSFNALFGKALYNSLVQGFLGAVFSFAFGFPLGVVLGRLLGGRGKLLRSFILLPFFLPSIVVVMAFLSLFGNGSFLAVHIPYLLNLSRGLTGITAINVFFNAPLVAFITSIGIEKSRKDLEESASSLGAGRAMAFRTLWGRDGIRGGISGSILSFLYCFSGFAVPLIIGGPSYFTIEAWIYYLVKTLGNFQLGALFGLVQTLFLLIPLAAYMWSMSGVRSVESLRAGNDDAKIPKRTKPYLSGMLYLYLFIFSEIMVLGSIAISSLYLHGGFSLSGYRELFGNTIKNSLGIPFFLPFANTLFYGLLTSIIVTAIGMAWIIGKRASSHNEGSRLDFVQLIPLMIPSIVMALGMLAIFGSSIGRSDLWILIVLVQSAVAVPVVLRVISAGFSEIPIALRESSKSLGGNAFFEVELPLSGATFATSLLFGFAISMGEFTATNFLSTNTYMPLSVEIYSLQGLRLIQASYAASSILLLLSIIFFYSIQKIGDRFAVVR